MQQTTFKTHGYKRVLCPNCCRFLKETRFGDKIREVKCDKCKNIKTIGSPRYGEKEGRSGIFWYEPDDSCWTAI